MRKTVCTGILICLFPCLVGCSSSSSLYESGMFRGKGLLARGEYREARDEFVKASTGLREAAPLAFAAVASYKEHDLASAMRFLREAGALPPDDSFLRIQGYRSLVLLAQGRKEEGLEALREYVGFYDSLDPLESIREVEAMAETGPVDLAALEGLLDRQIAAYEARVERFMTTGAGFGD
jgi:tetratricopeptide (TPR) repeat protein